MLLIILISIAICISFWLTKTGDSFFENAIPLCFDAILSWLLILLLIVNILPTFAFDSEVNIEGYHYDKSFPYDSLSYIKDGQYIRVDGNITIFEGGTKDILVIQEHYIDAPDWFWLISFLDISDRPWRIDYFIY